MRTARGTYRELTPHELTPYASERYPHYRQCMIDPMEALRLRGVHLTTTSGGSVTLIFACAEDGEHIHGLAHCSAKNITNLPAPLRLALAFAILNQDSTYSEYLDSIERHYFDRSHEPMRSPS
jgi:hypothetical protein